MLNLCEHLTFSCAVVIRCRALTDISSKFCWFSTNLLALFVHALCVECTLSSFKIVIGIIPFTFTLTNVLLYCCDRNHNWVLSIFCNLPQRTWLGTRFYHLICRRNEPAMTFWLQSMKCRLHLVWPIYGHTILTIAVNYHNYTGTDTLQLLFPLE